MPDFAVECPLWITRVDFGMSASCPIPEVPVVRFCR